MTHDTPPKRIWVTPDASGVKHEWHSGWYQGRPDGRYRVEYTLTSEADAMVAAALREAKGTPFPDSWRDDAHAVHDGRGLKAQRTWSAGYNACRDTIEALIPQPASAALDKLIAEAVNEAMLKCVGMVAEVRNQQEPGPIFAVLNEAIGRIESARFAVIREKSND